MREHSPINPFTSAPRQPSGEGVHDQHVLLGGVGKKLRSRLERGYGATKMSVTLEGGEIPLSLDERSVFEKRKEIDWCIDHALEMASTILNQEGRIDALLRVLRAQVATRVPVEEAQLLLVEELELAGKPNSGSDAARTDLLKKICLPLLEQRLSAEMFARIQQALDRSELTHFYLGGIRANVLLREAKDGAPISADVREGFFKKEMYAFATHAQLAAHLAFAEICELQHEDSSTSIERANQCVFKERESQDRENVTTLFAFHRARKSFRYVLDRSQTLNDRDQCARELLQLAKEEDAPIDIRHEAIKRLRDYASWFIKNEHRWTVYARLAPIEARLGMPCEIQIRDEQNRVVSTYHDTAHREKILHYLALAAIQVAYGKSADELFSLVAEECAKNTTYTSTAVALCAELGLDPTYCEHLLKATWPQGDPIDKEFDLMTLADAFSGIQPERAIPYLKSVETAILEGDCLGQQEVYESKSMRGRFVEDATRAAVLLYKQTQKSK